MSSTKNSPKTILVSIIVPCYKQAQYLDECLESVLNQTYENWECIIIDDGSPDNTEEIAKKWQLKNSKFKYIKKENGGVSSARNCGIEYAQGSWILPLDGDDKIEENYIEKASQQFDSDYKVIYCDVQKFGRINTEWHLPEFSLYNLAQDNIIHCSGFFKKSDWKAIGGYDTNMVYGIEDWEFWINLLKNGSKVYHINDCLFYYRYKDVSRDSLISNNQLNYKMMINYIEQKHYDFFSEQLGSIRENYKAKEKLLERYNSSYYKVYSKFISIFKK